MNEHPRTRLLNVPIDNCTLEAAVDDIAEVVVSSSGIHDREPEQFAFVNADGLNRAWRDESYRRLLTRLPRVYPDGSGIRWALRFVHRQRLLGNVNGTDLFPLLCRRAEDEGWTLALLGATAPVVERLVENLAAGYPRLEVVFAGDGYFAAHSESTTISSLAAARPDVLLVAMGSPRQSTWIDDHRSDLRGVGVAMGVGGLFDFYSGRVRRAPPLIRRIGMEWAWRITQEPGRLWRRYLLGNPTFVWRVITNRARDRSTG